MRRSFSAIITALLLILTAGTAGGQTLGDTAERISGFLFQALQTPGSSVCVVVYNPMSRDNRVYGSSSLNNNPLLRMQVKYDLAGVRLKKTVTGAGLPARFSLLEGTSSEVVVKQPELGPNLMERIALEPGKPALALVVPVSASSKEAFGRDNTGRLGYEKLKKKKLMTRRLFVLKDSIEVDSSEDAPQWFWKGGTLRISGKVVEDLAAVASNGSPVTELGKAIQAVILQRKEQAVTSPASVRIAAIDPNYECMAEDEDPTKYCSCDTQPPP